MGQYYVPVVLNEAGQIECRMCSWDFNNGAKLMEHSWIGNDFVAAFETLLLTEAPRRVVWAGDYADREVDAEGRPAMRTYDLAGERVVREANLHSLAQDCEPYRPAVAGLGERAQLIGDGVEVVRDPQLVANAFPRVAPSVEAFPYLVNWDKRIYVDKGKVPAVRYYWSGAEELAIHPLPLLTVEGNGQGGGDFQPSTDPARSAATGNVALIGAWARDHIALAARVPDGFAEVIFDLVEMGVVEHPSADHRVNARRDAAA